MNVVNVLARAMSLKLLVWLLWLDIVLRGPSSLDKDNFILLSNASILAGRSCCRSNTCRRGPIRIESVLIILLLIARRVKLDSIYMRYVPILTILAFALVEAVDLFVALNGRLAEATINNIDVAHPALMAWTRLCEKLTYVLRVGGRWVVAKVAHGNYFTFACCTFGFSSELALILKWQRIIVALRPQIE